MIVGVFSPPLPHITHDTNLSLVGHSEGTLNTGGQVFESSYKKRDAKELFQESRWKLSLQLVEGMHGICIQTTKRWQKPDQRGQIYKEMQQKNTDWRISMLKWKK